MEEEKFAVCKKKKVGDLFEIECKKCIVFLGKKENLVVSQA